MMRDYSFEHQPTNAAKLLQEAIASNEHYIKRLDERMILEKGALDQTQEQRNALVLEVQQLRHQLTVLLKAMPELQLFENKGENDDQPL